MLDRVFVVQVADAYNHLYDIIYLRTHPLAALLASDAILGREERAWQLHHLLLDVIDRLDPGPQAPAYSHVWRRHRLMLLRYAQGLDPKAVADRLSISRRTYYREHEEALGVAAHLLRERAPTRPVAEAPSGREGDDAPSRLELLRSEATRLGHAHGGDALLLDALQSATELVGELAQARGNVLRVEEWEAPLRVAVDRHTLRQVLLGMLSYLLETLEGGEIRVSLTTRDDVALLAVETQGGRTMSARRADDDRLALLGELAAMQGARLESLREDGERAGFRLELPLARARLILVVDDNEDVLQLFERYLAQYNYQVITAQTSAQALALARSRRPFAITLDLMMPDQDGWDVLQILANQPETEHIPVVVCTVLGAKELALSLGAASFLEKPVSQQALLAVLRSLEEAA